ncbi:unnamed protein product [Mytilus edulis]|uniref:Uncharacterized protein n=1 Tax=Mytilus edulis TaxID=6550 RepID=A0A8S3PPG3_MYTED|nr:unnamed protein product [Mytilus edulis]
MPWKSPCGPMDKDHIDKANRPLPTPNPDGDWIRLLVIVLEEINDCFIELKRLYISLEILDDYQKLASILVFVEQIVWENDTVGDRNDRDYLCNIYRKINDVLCAFRRHSQKTSIDKVTPTRNVMNSEYRLINRTERFQRNYIIFKDASRYITSGAALMNSVPMTYSLFEILSLLESIPFSIIKLVCCAAFLTEKATANSCLEGRIPWIKPCGYSSNPNTNPVGIHNEQWLTDIVTRSEELHRTSHHKEVYSTLLEFRYRLFHLEGFPIADNAKLAVWPFNLNDTIEAIDDYEKLSTVLVFVEAMLWDDHIIPNGNDGANLCSIVSKARDILCILKIEINDDELLRIPERNVMKTEYRQGDRTHKLGRNYLIFKDSIRYLQFMVDKYIRFIFS